VTGGLAKPAPATRQGGKAATSAPDTLADTKAFNVLVERVAELSARVSQLEKRAGKPHLRLRNV